MSAPRDHRGPSPAARVTRRIDSSLEVCLTFDDGPDAEWTPRVLDLLEANGMAATFFVIGRAARQYPGLLRRVSAAGHGIGNHTWSHRHPWLLPRRTARQEVRDGASAIADVTGRLPAAFRPPHGRLRGCMIDEAERGGQRVVLWSLSARDWGPLGSPSRIAARLASARAGDVILMHDGRPHVNCPRALLAVLADFLQTVIRRGLVAVALPDARA
jgi:peptidoglycan-N-acetylglucosamine deacetylase